MGGRALPGDFRHLYCAGHRGITATRLLGVAAKNSRRRSLSRGTLHEAPVLLFVAGWTRRGQEQKEGLFPAIQNILLACRAVGLGASLTTLTQAFRAELDPFLGLPAEQPSCAMLPIGWPKVQYRKPVRRSIDECLHFEKFPAGSGEETSSPAHPHPPHLSGEIEMSESNKVVVLGSGPAVSPQHSTPPAPIWNRSSSTDHNQAAN